MGGNRRSRSFATREPPAARCPWWLHWSRPEPDGQTPSFCSTCGSRTQSRRRLRYATSCLKRQVELLQEIARRQAEEIEDRRRQAASPFPASSAAAAPVPLLATHTATGATSAAVAAPPALPGRSSGHVPWGTSSTEGVRARSEELSAVRSEVAHLTGLTQQLEQWRVSGGPPTDWEAMLPQSFAGLANDGADESHREAQRGRWKAELDRLTQALAEVTQRSNTAASRSTAAGGSGDQGHEWLLEELAAERLATGAARRRAGRLRQEAAEERRALAQRQAAEELAYMRRQMQAERDLRLAQQAEIADVDRSAEELRAQLIAARTANAELRTALAQQQALLQRLRD